MKNMTSVSVLLVSTLLLALSFLAPCALATEQHVVSYLVETVGVYEQRGRSFKRMGKMAREDLPALPAPVLCSSPKGFVQVETAKGPVWLDTMDVAVDPPKTSGASVKNHSLSSSSQRKGFYSRGIGD